MKKKILLSFLLGLIIVSGYSQTNDYYINTFISRAERMEKENCPYEDIAYVYYNVIDYCISSNKDDPSKYYSSAQKFLSLYLQQLLENPLPSKEEKLKYIYWKLALTNCEWLNTEEIKELVRQIDEKLWS